MLNMDRQEHRALRELVHLLGLDTDDLERNSSNPRSRLEVWHHPSITGDIEVFTSSYSTKKGRMEGSRQITFQWGDHLRTVGYDVDGLREEPRFILEVGDVSFDKERLGRKTLSEIESDLQELRSKEDVVVHNVWLDGRRNP